MALGRKGLTCVGDQRVNCVHFTMCCFVLYFIVSTLLCMAVLCRATQSSVQELTGERSVLFIHRSLPHVGDTRRSPDADEKT
ncbi:unnamed protein product, partial [Staurois parvus]